MLRRWIGLSLIGIGLATGMAVAQTTKPTQSTTATSTAEAFMRLSPGNQKIARALFEAQQSSSATSKTLSLDDLAAKKLSGKGWGEIFNEMKSQGLVQERNLGQAVSKFNQRQKESTSGTRGTPDGAQTQAAKAKRPERSVSSRKASPGDEDQAASGAIGEGHAVGRGAGSGRHGGGRGR